MEQFDTREIDKLYREYHEERDLQQKVDKMEKAFKEWRTKNNIKLTEDNYNVYWEEFLREYNNDIGER